MRKLFAAVVMLGLMTVAAIPSFAGYTTIGTPRVFVASTTFTSAGTVNMQVALNSGSILTWAGDGLGGPAAGWQTASNYIILQSTITHTLGGIEIYTDNKNSIPPYTGVVVSSNTTSPAGLIDTSTTTKVLSMCWRVVTVTTTTTIMQGAYGVMDQGGPHNYPTRLWASELGNGYPCYLWMLDKGQVTSGYVGGTGGNTPVYTNGLDYQIIRDSTRGLQHGEATWGQTSQSPVYIYVGANFAGATTPNTYETTTLTIEAYHD